MECTADVTKTEFDTHTDTGLQFKSFVKEEIACWHFEYTGLELGVHRDSP